MVKMTNREKRIERRANRILKDIGTVKISKEHECGDKKFEITLYVNVHYMLNGTDRYDGGWWWLSDVRWKTIKLFRRVVKEAIDKAS